MAVEGVFQQVYDALQKLDTECPIEEVVALCPNLTWNQVFLAIDYLSRTGYVRVIQDPGRTYRVQALPAPVLTGSFPPASPLVKIGQGN
jgi:hypothetical protein